MHFNFRARVHFEKLRIPKMGIFAKPAQSCYISDEECLVYSKAWACLGQELTVTMRSISLIN